MHGLDLICSLPKCIFRNELSFKDRHFSSHRQFQTSRTIIFVRKCEPNYFMPSLVMRLADWIWKISEWEGVRMQLQRHENQLWPCAAKHCAQNVSRFVSRSPVCEEHLRLLWDQTNEFATVTVTHWMGGSGSGPLNGWGFGESIPLYVLLSQQAYSSCDLFLGFQAARLGGAELWLSPFADIMCTQSLIMGKASWRRCFIHPPRGGK